MLPLSVTVPSVRTTRFVWLVVYAGQVGALASLNVFGLPERTKDSQYAMSSDANAFSEGVMGEKVPVPLNL